ncbi:MAG: flagellar filament capping protein FliD [Legionella sp.]|nr:flagellar filament capping protein FliD [Legionella sp.]
MGLSSPGIGSGLDIKGMVEAMVKADVTRMQVRHDKKLDGVNTELSAMSQLKSVLSNLQTTLSNLSNMSQFYKMKSTLSDPAYCSVTVDDEAKVGVYQIQVKQLAQSQNLSSTYYADNSAPVGSGNLTINFGTYSSDNSTFTINTEATPLNITIDPANNSLSAVCDALNAASSGVNASIVQDSQGSRISISSLRTGENYAMQISGDVTALNYDPTTAVTSLTQTVAAQNSIANINGMTLNQSSNQLKNAITGISLDLKQADENKTVSLTIENNQDQLSTCLNDFLKKYNDCILFLTNLTGFNMETKKGGIYQGDTQLKSLKTNLYQMVNSITSNDNTVKTLADIGIKPNKSGFLEINMETYGEALKTNYKSIGAIFANTISATDPNIKLSSIDTKMKAGTYNIALSEYTPGISVAGTINGLPAKSKDGITLTGIGDFSSLSFDVIGGSTGDRGQIIVNAGLAVKMNSIMDSFLSTKGELDKRTQGLDNKVADLKTTQERIDTRSTFLEQKYLKQWIGVDQLISRMQDTSKMMTQILDNLPKLKTK